MEIIRAKHSGFCFGVKKAVETAYQETRQQHNHLFTHGQLIHNRDVTDELEQLGARIIDSLSDAPEGSTVIVRSHGETKQFYQEAQQAGIRLVETTCPFVSRIHSLVQEAYEAGKTIVIIGDPDHPELCRQGQGEHYHYRHDGQRL